jgi:hypothetical protein
MIVAFLFFLLVAGRAHGNQVVRTICPVRRAERAKRNDVVDIQLTTQIFFSHSARTAFERIPLPDTLSHVRPVPTSELGSTFEPDLGSMIVPP